MSTGQGCFSQETILISTLPARWQIYKAHRWGAEWKKWLKYQISNNVGTFCHCHNITLRIKTVWKKIVCLLLSTTDNIIWAFKYHRKRNDFILSIIVLMYVVCRLSLGSGRLLEETVYTIIYRSYLLNISIAHEFYLVPQETIDCLSLRRSIVINKII